MYNWLLYSANVSTFLFDKISIPVKTKFDFGKYNNESVLDIFSKDVSYINWAIKNIPNFILIEDESTSHFYIDRQENEKKIFQFNSINTALIEIIDEVDLLNLVAEYGWESMVTKIDLSESIIEKYSKYLDWVSISKNQTLSEKFLIDHTNELDWNAISRTQNLSENFLNSNKDKINFKYLLYNNKIKLTDSFIQENIELIGFDNISNFPLSEDFIERHKDRLNWRHVCMRSKLTEAFIINHRQYIVWYDLFEYQELSEDFIWKYRHLFDTNKILKSNSFSQDFISRITKLRAERDFLIIADLFKDMQMTIRDLRKKIRECKG